MNTTQVTKIPETLVEATVKITGQDNNGTGFVCSVPFIEDDNTYLIVSNKHVLKNFNEKSTSVFFKPKNQGFLYPFTPDSKQGIFSP